MLERWRSADGDGARPARRCAERAVEADEPAGRRAGRRCSPRRPRCPSCPTIPSRVPIAMAATPGTRDADVAAARGQRHRRAPRPLTSRPRRWRQSDRQADAGEHPPRRRREEVAVRAAGVARGRRQRAAAQHLLVDHELAVVLADRAGRRAEPGVRRVRAGRPLPRRAVPPVAVGVVGGRARRPPTRPRSAAGRRASGRTRRPRTSSRAARDRPGRPARCRRGRSAATGRPSRDQYSGASQPSACTVCQPSDIHSSGRR